MSTIFSLPNQEAGMTNIEIWRAANLLIKQHGSLAELEACRLADLMLDRGDRDGQLVWLRIRRVIAALEAPPTGAVH